MMLQATLTGDYLNIFLAGVFVMLLLAMSLVAFFVTYQRRIFAQERLRRQEAAAHQRQLLVAAVEVQENERRRIASDLHDDIGSLLTATRLYLRQLAPAGEADRIGKIKDKSLNIVDEMITNTRRITHNLLPPALEKFGFQAATEDLCERMEGTDNVSITFTSDTDKRLPAKAEIALYRAVQELLNNTLKHAEATQVAIRLGDRREHFELGYHDDGKGFDLTNTRNNGLGLRNIESRITLLNGTLNWTTAPGDGLEVNITIPYETPTHQ